VPICAAARMVTAVILARCSVAGRRREIADSGAVGGTHNTNAERGSMVLTPGAADYPCNAVGAGPSGILTDLGIHGGSIG